MVRRSWFPLGFPFPPLAFFLCDTGHAIIFRRTRRRHRTRTIRRQWEACTLLAHYLVLEKPLGCLDQSTILSGPSSFSVKPSNTSKSPPPPPSWKPPSSKLDLRKDRGQGIPPPTERGGRGGTHAFLLNYPHGAHGSNFATE